MDLWHRRNAVVTRRLGKRLQKGVATVFWDRSIVRWTKADIEREAWREGLTVGNGSESWWEPWWEQESRNELGR